MRKRKKKRVKNTLLPVRFQRRLRPKAVDQSQRSNLSLVETECLSGGLCGRQDLP